MTRGLGPKELQKIIREKIASTNSARGIQNIVSGNGIKEEGVRMYRGVKESIRRATVNYRADPNSYEKNKNRALIGIGGGGLAGLILPPVGTAMIFYGCIKASQAYRDRKSR